MVDDPSMTPADRIRLYRRRAGLTQEQAAQLKGCTVSAWRKWESGERQVHSLGDWVEIARILRVKDFYRLTGLPVGQLPDEQPEHESVPAIRAALHAYADGDDGEEIDLARLRAAVAFAWDSWHEPGRRFSRTWPMLPGLIVEVRSALRRSTDPEFRREAHRIAADLYMLVRPYVKRLGAPDISIIAADRAMASAEAADDPLRRAAAAWNLGNVLSNRGSTEEAAGLCRAAIADLASIDDRDPRRLALLGNLHLLLAVQESRLHHEPAALKALDTARGLAGVTDETNHFHLVFGPANVGIHKAAVALELSRPAEARRVAEQVDVGPLPSAERRHSHYLELARAYAAQREDLGAVHMLLRADRESPEESMFSLPLRAVARDLLARESPATRPDLRPLAERMGIA